jgi:cell division transport system permease protein
MATKRSTPTTPGFARPFGQPPAATPDAPTEQTSTAPESETDNVKALADPIPTPISEEKAVIHKNRRNERSAGHDLIHSFPFLLRETMTNLRRHGFMTVAAITTIAVALALLGAFLVTFYEINTAAQRAVSDFEVRIFCKLALPKSEVEKLRPKIRALPGVATVSFLSRDQVWAEQKKNYAIDISGIPNQMNDTYVVTLSDPAQAGKIAQTVRGWPEVQEIAIPENELEGVRRVASFLRTVGGISSILLLLGSLIVVSNTIRASVSARHREIKIMQIVGAAPWFIRTPLLLEGLIHYSVGTYVSGLIKTTLPMLVPYGGRVDVLAFSLALIGAGALVGASGSLLSMHRYLRIH